MVKICVIGSCAMDLVVTAHKRPLAGETILGESFSIVPGGKGANQAIAAARLGADVYMVGCVGKDHYGTAILDNFTKNKVNTTYIEQSTEADSGTAHIILAEEDNSIIVIKGANNLVTPMLIDKSLDAIMKSDIVLIQQEIPEETVIHVSELCKKNNVPLLLNPAPSRHIPDSVIEQASYITPNEHEYESLFPQLSMQEALKKYANKLFITEGSRGVRYFNGNEEMLVPTYKVQVVDSTGAGDTFNAALAVALAEKQPITNALKFANRAASLSVTKFGAQGGMPTRKEVEVSL